MANSRKKHKSPPASHEIDPYGPDPIITEIPALQERVRLLRRDRDGVRLYIARLAGQITAIVAAAKIPSTGTEAIAVKAQTIDELSIDLVAYTGALERAQADLDRRVNAQTKAGAL